MRVRRNGHARRTEGRISRGKARPKTRIKTFATYQALRRRWIQGHQNLGRLGVHRGRENDGLLRQILDARRIPRLQRLPSPARNTSVAPMKYVSPLQCLQAIESSARRYELAADGDKCQIIYVSTELLDCLGIVALTQLSGVIQVDNNLDGVACYAR